MSRWGRAPINETLIIDDEPTEIAWRASSCCHAPLAWSAAEQSQEIARCLGCGAKVTEWTVRSDAGPILRATISEGAADVCEGKCECRVITRGRCDR